MSVELNLEYFVFKFFFRNISYPTIRQYRCEHKNGRWHQCNTDSFDDVDEERPVWEKPNQKDGDYNGLNYNLAPAEGSYAEKSIFTHRGHRS